jgi:hypothetical protein
MVGTLSALPTYELNLASAVMISGDYRTGVRAGLKLAWIL